jgi:hypothetical protein
MAVLISGTILRPSKSHPKLNDIIARGWAGTIKINEIIDW